MQLTLVRRRWTAFTVVNAAPGAHLAAVDACITALTFRRGRGKAMVQHLPINIAPVIGAMWSRKDADLSAGVNRGVADIVCSSRFDVNRVYQLVIAEHEHPRL